MQNTTCAINSNALKNVESSLLKDPNFEQKILKRGKSDVAGNFQNK